MNKLKFIDVLNSAITEFYGENAVPLLKLFSSLNQKGQANVLDYADVQFSVPEKYSRTMKLVEQTTSKDKQIKEN